MINRAALTQWSEFVPWTDVATTSLLRGYRPGTDKSRPHQGHHVQSDYLIELIMPVGSAYFL
jgi:hypothetical protein